MAGKPSIQKTDYAHAVIQSIASLVPGFGEFLSLVLSAPIEKRREEWIESIEKGLHELQERLEEFDINKLHENETFTTVFLTASQMAMRNHQEEKLEALRNAVLNSSLVTNPNDNIQHIFLQFVDYLTPLHLKVLKYFDGLIHVEIDRGFDLEIAIALESIFPDLSGNRNLTLLVLNDLQNRGLIVLNLTSEYRPPEYQKRERGISKLGREFLDYIASPYSRRQTNQPRLIIIDKVRKSADSLNAAGIEHSNKGELDLAIEAFSEAILIDPSHSAAYANRANAYIEIDEIQKALADRSRIVEIDHSHISYWERASLFFSLRDWESAQKDINKAIDLSGKFVDPGYHIFRGLTYLLQRDENGFIADLKKARDRLSEVIEQYNPDQPIHYFTLKFHVDSLNLYKDIEGGHISTIALIEEIISLINQLETYYREAMGFTSSE